MATPVLRKSTNDWRMAAAAPTSTPHVSCAAISTRGSLQDFPPDNKFLKIAAGKTSRLGMHSSASHIEVTYTVCRESLYLGCTHQSEPHHVVTMRGEQTIVAERHRCHDAPTQSVLWHKSHTQVAPRPGVQMAGLLAVYSNLRGLFPRERLLAAQGGQQLLLAVARYSRDADNLTAVHAETDVFEIRTERIIGGPRKALDD